MKKGLFHNFFLSCLTTIGLLISLSAPAQSTAFSRPLSSHNSPEKTVAGPYSSNRLKGSSRRKFTPRNRNKIRLESKIPRNLGVANYSVVWNVKSLKGRNKRHKARGKLASMSLSPGKYRLTMQIGNYKEQKVIHVRRSRNKVQSFNMPIRAGLLKVTTSSKASLGNAVIKVTDHRGKVVATSKGKPLKRLLKSGTYTVTYRYGNERSGRNEKVRITSGSVKVTKIKMPVSSKVRISAYVKGNQPLMKKSTSWVITDSRGNVVKRTKKNNIRMSLYPGTYTAHLTVAGKKTSKKFRVKSGQKSNVSLRL